MPPYAVDGEFQELVINTSNRREGTFEVLRS